MPITPAILESLAKSVDLRIEALNVPSSPGQPQDFQIRPASLSISPIPQVTIPPPIPLGGLIPTEASLSTAIPVEVSVDWGIEDVGGNSVDLSEAVFCSRGGPTSSNLDRSLQATVMVLPDFVELVRDPTEVPAKTRYVTASVTLKVDLAQNPQEPRFVEAKVPVLRHPITVPAIPIPTVAIFFAKPTLGVVPGSDPPELQGGDQYALIVVPHDSPIGGITALRTVFDKLLKIGGTLNKVVGLAELGGLAPTGVLPALNELGVGLAPIDGLLGALNVHQILGGRVGVAFVTADQIPNLNSIETIRNANYWGFNDVEAEDTISSFVLLGPPGRQLRCFQHRNFEGAHLTVTTGPACLAIVNEMVNVPPQNVLPDRAGVEPDVSQEGTVALNDRFSAIAFL